MCHPTSTVEILPADARLEVQRIAVLVLLTYLEPVAEARHALTWFIAYGGPNLLFISVQIGKHRQVQIFIVLYIESSLG